MRNATSILAITLVSCFPGCGSNDGGAPSAEEASAVDVGGNRAPKDAGSADSRAAQDSGARTDSHASDAKSDSGSSPASAVKGAYGFLVGMQYDAKNATIQSVMGNPDVDGVFIGFPWATIAPTSTGQDFSKIDAWLDAAVAAGKRVSIGIQAGSATP